MIDPPHCPHCQSDDIAYNRKRHWLKCFKCRFEGSPEGEARMAAPPLARATQELDPIKASARQLAEEFHAGGRLADLCEQWPAPIAHELDALYQLLHQGHIVAAFYQLRDVLEVLIKLPAVILARDVIEHGEALPVGPDEAAAPGYVRRTLFAASPSLGHWLGLLRELSKAVYAARREDRCHLLAPGIAGLVYRLEPGPLPAKAEPTRLHRALEGLVAWRNNYLGHGAFRPDLQENLAILRHYLVRNLTAGNSRPLPRVQTLADALQAAWDSAPWAGLDLRVGDSTGRLLRGAAAIRPAHEGNADTPHSDTERPLLLQAPGGNLGLQPYAAARLCDICSQQDVFFYNGFRQGERGAASRRYHLLEYRRAHPMERHWHQARALLAEQEAAQSTSEPSTDTPDVPEASYASAEMVALLDEVALEYRFIPPAYLYQRLNEFLQQHSKGIFWLTAPAHVGKSMFVAGLTGWPGANDPPVTMEKNDQPVATAAFFIRREYRFGPGALRNRLGEALHKALGLSPEADQQRGLPELNLEKPECAEAFIDWLQQYRRRSPERALLVCLDGLDELPQPVSGETSILDYLPAPDRLPDGIYLLLTSRPGAAAQTALEDRCPDWVQDTLSHRLGQDGPLEVFALERDHPGYRILLRAYFDRELAETLISTARQTFDTWLRQAHGNTDTPPATPKAPLDRLAAIRDRSGQRLDRRLRDIWTLALAEHGRQTPKDPPAEVLREMSETFDGVFEELFRKAERRFLYLAYLVDQVKEQEITLADLAALPAGDALHRHFLERLDHRLAPKQADLARQLLLVLAATEQAHT